MGTGKQKNLGAGKYIGKFKKQMRDGVGLVMMPGDVVDRYGDWKNDKFQ